MFVQVRSILSDTQNTSAAARVWLDLIVPRLSELVHSYNRHERMGGVFAIDHLLEIEHDDAVEMRATKFHRMYQYVKAALLFHHGDVELTSAAIKPLNRVLELGINFGDSFMEQEIPSLLLELGHENDHNRYGAVLILKAFARHMSHQFYHYVHKVLLFIWTPLRDPKAYVREAGADLLASCFDVVGERPNNKDVNFSPAKILKEAVQGLRSTAVDNIHGSLLAYRMILLHSSSVRTYSFKQILPHSHSTFYVPAVCQRLLC
jgi:FKBP12-rapamycin complex-associated protein